MITLSFFLFINSARFIFFGVGDPALIDSDNLVFRKIAAFVSAGSDTLDFFSGGDLANPPFFNSSVHDSECLVLLEPVNSVGLDSECLVFLEPVNSVGLDSECLVFRKPVNSVELDSECLVFLKLASSCSVKMVFLNSGEPSLSDSENLALFKANNPVPSLEFWLWECWSRDPENRLNRRFDLLSKGLKLNFLVINIIRELSIFLFSM